MYEELKDSQYTGIFKPSEFVAQDAIRVQKLGAGRLDMLPNYFPKSQDPINIRRVRYGIGIRLDCIFAVQIQVRLAPDQKIAFMTARRQFQPYIRGLIDETLEILSKRREVYNRFHDRLGEELFLWYESHPEWKERIGIIREENGNMFVKQLESLVQPTHLQTVKNEGL